MNPDSRSVTTPDRPAKSAWRPFRRGIAAVGLLLGILFAVLFWTQPYEPIYRERPLHAWLSEIDSVDPTLRSNALATLKEADVDAIPHLLRYLRERDPLWQKPFLFIVSKLPTRFRSDPIRTMNPFEASRYRRAALEVLRFYGTNVPVQPVAQSLADPRRQVAIQAATTLANMNAIGVPALLSALHHPADQARFAAAYGLSLSGTNAHDALPSLLNNLTNRTSGVRTYLAQAIVNMRTLAVPALIDTLDDENVERRRDAAWILGRIGPQAASAIPALNAKKDDPDALTRLRVEEALPRIRPKE